MSIGLLIVVIIIAFAINAIFATKMQEIAEMKGSKENYWVWCFFLPLYGFMLVNSLPDRIKSNTDSDRNNLDKEKSIADELPEL